MYLHTFFRCIYKCKYENFTNVRFKVDYNTNWSIITVSIKLLFFTF